MAGLQTAATLPAVPVHHDDLVHVPQSHLGLQAPLVGRVGGGHAGSGVRPAGGQLRLGPVQAVAVEEPAPCLESRNCCHRISADPLIGSD